MSMSKMVSVSMVTAAVTVVLVCGLSMMRHEELPLERYGLPKGYGRPANIKNWNDEVICILYPDGNLEKRASDDLIIRTLIDRLVEGQKQMASMGRVLRRADVALQKQEVEIQKKNQGWFKRLISRKKKKEGVPSKQQVK